MNSLIPYTVAIIAIVFGVALGVILIILAAEQVVTGIRNYLQRREGKGTL